MLLHRLFKTANLFTADDKINKQNGISQQILTKESIQCASVWANMYYVKLENSPKKIRVLIG